MSETKPPNAAEPEVPKVNTEEASNLPPSGGAPMDEEPKKKCCLCAWVAITLATLALLIGIVLSLVKAPNSAVDEVRKISVEASAKAESANKKADQALVASAKKSEVTCSVCEVTAPKKADTKPKANKPKKPVIPYTVPAPVAPAAVPPQVLSNLQAQEVHLLWRAHDATPTNPKPCIISGGDGAGLPPYCSGFSVKPVNNGETKNAWLVRVGGGHRPTDTGMYTQK